MFEIEVSFLISQFIPYVINSLLKVTCTLCCRSWYHRWEWNLPDSSHQERLRQYAEVSLLPVLVEQGWCSLVPELLASPEHDCREKALRTLLAMMAQCQTQYKQNPALTASLSELQKQYQELVLTEQDVGEQDGYFAEILALVDSMVVKMRQV